MHNFSEVNSGFYYKSAAEREKLVQAERAFTDSKVQKIIDLKRQVCDAAGDGKKKGFVVINMKVLYMRNECTKTFLHLSDNSHYWSRLGWVLIIFLNVSTLV